MDQHETRTYWQETAVTFRKTDEPFGGLSNMAPGFPLMVAGREVRTAEALYQACRFPHRPEVQRMIIQERSPMTAKMRSKPYRDDSRADWESVRVRVMRWCLRVKLVQHWESFGSLLIKTGDRPIVESSRKDAYWGAQPQGDGSLVGCNVLGRLLMELRAEIVSLDEAPREVDPPDVSNFLLLGEPIPPVTSGSAAEVTPISLFPDRPDTREESELGRATDEAAARNRKRSMDHRKKLIEVALPLEAINRESAREKSIRHGHPSTLHLWWARRPLAACRAVLFASIVDDPSSRPEEFPTEEAQEVERQRLFRIIEELVKWENSTNETVLAQARAEIMKATDGNPPPVLDPFCGGGSIPLEAQRLGLDAHASDLNPVAVLITKALIEIPSKFAGKPPVNPDARQRLEHTHSSTGAQGLADDVRYYGKWMRDKAFDRIGALYPRAKLSDGSDAAVIAWLWARTATCPNPACRVAAPLVSSFLLSSKAGREAYVEPVVKDGSYLFEVRLGTPADIAAAKNGTRAGKAQDFRCIVCDTTLPRTYIREEGKAGRLSANLMAVVAEGTRHRVFLPPTADHVAAAAVDRMRSAIDDARASFLSGSTPTRAMITGGVCSAYGLTTWGQLFTDRQLAALITFSDLVGEAQEQVLADGGDTQYADAVATYLALAVDRGADYWSSICGWHSGRELIRNTFARQALPMVWDFAEANPFSDSAGSFGGSVAWTAKALEAVPGRPAGHARQLDAMAAVNGVQEPIACTDPPYYDNIGYAELSDFFYVWLRRALGRIYPDLFSTLLTPKTQELVVIPYRFGGDRAVAQRFFEQGLRTAFELMREAHAPDYPLTLFYAFKQAESADGSVASTGWDTMLSGLLDSGLAVTGTWPVRSELANRTVASAKNALASSIVLVCRPRFADAPIATRREFANALRGELPQALKQLQHGNIAPVDLAQAAVGPGMAVFSRFAKTLEADGQPMTVRSALGLINQVLDEILSEQEGDFDPDTRFALTWFEQRGTEEGSFGEADVLARAKNTSVAGMVDAGVLVSRAGKVRLLRRDEMPDDWDPVTDRRPTAWEAAQHLTRRLHTGGEATAAELLRRLGGGYGEQARELAYRLYSICERKSWSQEALPYNALVVAWPEIARRVAGTPGPEAQQALEV